MSSSNNVLVFGGAGAVGRAAAISASKRGAKVWLAMRDTSKSIPNLNAADEKNAGFERIQADLLDTPSLKAAVAKSQASIAFLYTIQQAEDAMRSTFEALKEAGITDIVLLSSYNVRPSPDAAKDEDYITRVHALVELQLIASGLRYVTLRPGYFNSNLAWAAKGFEKGEVKLFCPETVADYIAPEDIGIVAGAVLTTPSARLPLNEKNGKSIFLCGPKLMSIREAVMIVAKVLGKEVQITEMDEDSFRESMKFLPTPLVDALVKSMKENVPPNTHFTDDLWRPACGNIRKYAEKEPMSLEDWVRIHKDELQ